MPNPIFKIKPYLEIAPYLNLKEPSKVSETPFTFFPETAICFPSSNGIVGKSVASVFWISSSFLTRAALSNSDTSEFSCDSILSET